MNLKHILLTLLWLGAAARLAAQVEVHTEAQLSGAMGDHMPLWLNANRQGLSSLDSVNAYVRAGVFRPLQADSARRWGWGAGADVAVAQGFSSRVVLHQAYGQLRWLRGVLTVGSQEQSVQLKNQELSSGAQTLGINARPVPGVRLSLPDYWTVPLTRGWIGLKGHLFYGQTTDDAWQRDFTRRQSRYTEHAKLHTKAGYLRIKRPGGPLSVELGLEMGAQYGGTSHVLAADGNMVAVKNEDGLKGMLHALVPSSGEATETGTVYQNADGNHVGSWLARISYDRPTWGLSVYADHYFEDQSSMFFLDYNGYGTGDEWDTWKDSRWFVYDLKDALVGVELRLPRFPYMNTVVLEYLYTKYQCGPVYHDHTPVRSEHVSGIDEYYNHHVFTGWQHWGQVMGNPLYRSPLYNADGRIYVDDNRFWAWHLGVGGQPISAMTYRILATLQRGWGTYRRPLVEPRYNMSLLFEGQYSFGRQAEWSVRGALGMDFGGLLGDNIGAQVTIGRRFCLSKHTVKK